MYGYFGQNQPNKLLRIIYYIPNFLGLAWNLFRDRRIKFYIKAIPVLGIILSISYILFPIDFLPDIIVFIGQLDDLTAILIFMIPSLWIFIKGCPRELVKEHAHKIDKRNKA